MNCVLLVILSKFNCTILSKRFNCLAVSINITVKFSVFLVNARSSTSGVLLQIDLQVRYKDWYNPLEHGDSSYVVDFEIHSNYEPLLSDLEKVSSSLYIFS